uniref:S-adenosylmethionine:tRNA ribosyltransferase-isomerase n=1 Tax=Lygus hesperus TaxID=30085 RepID=A0A0A9X1A9_LYGHE
MVAHNMVHRFPLHLENGQYCRAKGKKELLQVSSGFLYHKRLNIWFVSGKKFIFSKQIGILWYKTRNLDFSTYQLEKLLSPLHGRIALHISKRKGSLDWI